MGPARRGAGSEPCRALVAAVDAGDLDATTTVEVVQEFAHLRARRRGREDASSLARSYVELFSPLITVDVDDLFAGLELFADLESLGAFDAVLVAASRRREMGGIVSADAAFSGVPGLRHFDPASPGFLDAVRGVG